MRINRSYFLQASSLRDALVGGERALETFNLSPTKAPSHLGTSRRSLIISRIIKWGLLFSASDHLFLYWRGFDLLVTFGSIFYQRSIFFRELPHVTALLSTTYLQGKIGGVPGIECIRSLASRLSRIHHFALSKFHQTDLYFSDLEFKYLLMTCSMTLLEKKSINLCYFYI